MTLDEWMYEEEQRLMNGINSWKRFQENKKNRESEDYISTTQDRQCDSCEHSCDGNINNTETCHECMWDSKYEPRRE